MCFMTFVSLSSGRLLQRWDNKWTETEDCRLYVICRYYFRLSVQNADTSAMISSGSEHTGRHSQDPAIWCDMLPHNDTTLQHGRGNVSAGCSVHCCSTACNRRCLLRRSRCRPGVPRCRLPGRTEIFLLRISLTVLTDAPNQEQWSTETIVMMGRFFYFCLDHLALKLERILSLRIYIPRQQNFILALNVTFSHKTIRCKVLICLESCSIPPSIYRTLVVMCWVARVRTGDSVDTSAQLLSAAARCLSCRAVITGGSHRLLSTLSTRASNVGPQEGS